MLKGNITDLMLHLGVWWNSRLLLSLINTDSISLFSLLTQMIKQILLINFYEYLEYLIHIHWLKIKLFKSILFSGNEILTHYLNEEHEISPVRFYRRLILIVFNLI